MKFFYVKRFDSNGVSTGIVEIPEKHLRRTLNNNPLWKVWEESKPKEFGRPPKVVDSSLSCPLCGENLKNSSMLKRHKKKHYES